LFFCNVWLILTPHLLICLSGEIYF
jgi:hypothetical protein